MAVGIRSSSLVFTNHVIARMQARGISETDVYHVYRYGSIMEDGGNGIRYAIDFSAYTRLRDAIGDDAIRLFGLWCVVTPEGVVITTFWRHSDTK